MVYRQIMIELTTMVQVCGSGISARWSFRSQRAEHRHTVDFPYSWNYPNWYLFV